MKAKRQIEVFTAGCPVCEPAVELVQGLACPDCEVTVHDLRQEGAEKVEAYGIKTVPAVVVDGRLVSCCENSGPRSEELEAAGIGQGLG
ncbi:MAG: glutaredoxin family protein [Actinomycetota bacterium]